jgi:hypothetical protein
LRTGCARADLFCVDAYSSLPGGHTYKEWDSKAANRSDADEKLGAEKNKDTENEMKPVVEKPKKALGDRVKFVKLSRRIHSRIVAIGTRPLRPVRADDARDGSHVDPSNRYARIQLTWKKGPPVSRPCGIYPPASFKKRTDHAASA